MRFDASTIFVFVLTAASIAAIVLINIFGRAPKGPSPAESNAVERREKEVGPERSRKARKR